jgi:plasmid stabilization system protein ParE
MTVIISDRAERDFAAQVRWLSENSPRVGKRAAMRILHILDLLDEFPDLGTKLTRTLREKQVQFGRDGFVIRYSRRNDAIIIHRIFHTRQDR